MRLTRRTILRATAAGALIIPKRAARAGLIFHGGASGFPPLLVNAGPSWAPMNTSTLSGTNNCLTTRSQHWTGPSAMVHMQLGFVNAWLGQSGQGELITNLGNMIVESYVEYSGLSGGVQQITWSGGNANSGTKAPSTNIFYTDETPLTGTIPANTSFHIRTTIQAANRVVPNYAPSTQLAPATFYGDTQIVIYTGAVGDGNDQANGTGPLTGGSSTGGYYTPILILARAFGGSSFALIGDSGETGHGDTQTTDANGNRGIGARAMFNGGNQLPYVSLSVGSNTCAAFS